MIIARRSFLFGLGAIITAPAIVHAENIMRVRPLVMRGPALELIGLGGDSVIIDIMTAQLVMAFGQRDLDVIAARIMAAQLVIVR